MRAYDAAEFAGLPGAELVTEGVDDLNAARDTPLAALVCMAAPRLRGVGIDIPSSSDGQPSHRLYALLTAAEPDSAHTRYNALVGRIVSFARAAERGSER